jgi:reactive intermediate/imine deaminase
MNSQIFRTDLAPAPAGPYSQAVKRGGILAVAGQVGVDPATGKLVDGGIEEQTRQALENLRNVLTEAQASFSDVVMVRVYLTELEHFSEMNKVYSEVLPEPYPARTTVFTGLGPGMLIEVDALASVG